MTDFIDEKELAGSDENGPDDRVNALVVPAQKVSDWDNGQERNLRLPSSMISNLPDSQSIDDALKRLAKGELSASLDDALPPSKTLK